MVKLENGVFLIKRIKIELFIIREYRTSNVTYIIIIIIIISLKLRRFIDILLLLLFLFSSMH